MHLALQLKTDKAYHERPFIDQLYFAFLWFDGLVGRFFAFT